MLFLANMNVARRRYRLQYELRERQKWIYRKYEAFLASPWFPLLYFSFSMITGEHRPGHHQGSLRSRLKPHLRETKPEPR